MSHHHMRHRLKSKEALSSRGSQNHHSSSSVVIVHVSQSKNWWQFNQENPVQISARLLLICCLSFRYGSRAGQEDNHLDCESGQVVSHSKNDDHHHQERIRGWNGIIISKKTKTNTFSHDHRLNPRIPRPTSFNGVKPSFMEWSEEVIAFLAVTDNQEFIPLVAAAFSSKDVIERNVIFKWYSFRLHGRGQEKKRRSVNKEADKTFRLKTNLKKFGISQKTFNRLWQKSQTQGQIGAENSTLIKVNFLCVTYFFMRLQEAQTSWSEEPCGLQTHIQTQSLDWRSGVTWLINLQGHQKPRRSLCSSKSCHLLSGMWRSQRVSFGGTIIGWSSSQNTKRSVAKRSRTQSNPFCSSECQRQPCSVAECQCQRHHYMVSGLLPSHQLCQQRSPSGCKMHLSVKKEEVHALQKGKGKGDFPL